MNDVFKDMQVKVGCEYISGLINLDTFRTNYNNPIY